MVTAIVNDPGAVKGQVLDWTGAESFNAICGSGAHARGDVLCKDTGTSPDSYKLFTAGANQAGPFVMALETKAAGVTHCSVVKGGTWALTADGTIEFGDDVGMSASTAGEVVALVAADVTATPTESTIEAGINYFKRKVGVCSGFVDNYKRGTQVAVVDGDLVAVDANAGYRGG